MKKIIALTDTRLRERHHIFCIDGSTVAINAKSLGGLKPGMYIINGQKRVIK